MDTKYIMEIPKQLREMFKNKKSNDYVNDNIRMYKKSNDYVNDNIRMYKKSNLKMYKNVHS